MTENYSTHDVLPIQNWAAQQLTKLFPPERASEEAAGWCARWTADRDGTLRWGWLDRSELEDIHADEVKSWPRWMAELTGREESEMAWCSRLAITAMSDPNLTALIYETAEVIEEDEYQFDEDEFDEEPMTSNVIQPNDSRPLSLAEKIQMAEEWLTDAEPFEIPRLERRISKFKQMMPPAAQQQGTNAANEAILPQNHASKRANQILDALLANNDTELERLAAIPMLVDGLIPAESVGMVYGESGSYKSFLMVDLAACVATGEPFAGHDIDVPGDVIYLAAEGGNGIRKRLRAWEQVHGRKADGVRILPLGLIVDDVKERHLLIAAIDEMRRRTGREVQMIILDTLSQTALGDDNSNRDMAAYVNACSELKEHFRCAVNYVHHTGKSGEGFRGAYALTANVDFQFCVKKVGTLFAEFIHEKSKDGELMQTKRFSMKPIVIEGILDHKGRPIDTLVPSAIGLMQEAHLLSTTTEREQLLIAALKAQTGTGGHPECDRKALRDDFKDALIDAEADLDDEAARKAFSRCLASLSKRGFLRYTKTTVTRLF